MSHRLFSFFILFLLSQSVSAQQLCPAFDERGFYGYKDSTETFIIPPIYNYAWPFSEGFARVLLDNRSFQEDSIGFINEAGEAVFSRKFLKALDFSEGFSAVKTDSTWNFISSKGILLDSAGFQDVRSFSKGYAKVKKNGLWGLINKEGELVISCIYEFIGTPAQKKADEGLDLLCLREPYKFGFEYYQPLEVVNGAVPFYRDSLWGYVSLKGKEIISPSFTKIRPFKGKTAIAKKKDGWVLINNKYKVLTQESYLEVGDFHEKLAAVRRKDTSGRYPDGLWGFINLKGKTVIPHEYDRVFFPFADGIAIVGKSSGSEILAGAINKKNKVLIPFEFEEIKEKRSGTYLVRDTTGKWGTYSAKGQQIINTLYESLIPIQNRGFIAESDGKWGILSTGGDTLLPLIYKKVSLSERNRVETSSFAVWKSYSADSLKERCTFSADTAFTQYHHEYPYRTENNSTITDFSKSCQASAEPVNLKMFTCDFGHSPSESYDRPATLKGDFLFIASGAENDSILATQKLTNGIYTTAISTAKRFGILDSLYKWVLQPDYDHILYIKKEGLFLLKNGELYGIMDDSLNFTLPLTPDYDTVGFFSNGLAPVKKDGAAGFIDPKGNVRISLQYQDATSFSEGLAAIKLMGKWGFIDMDEQIAVQPEYDTVSNFYKGAALVKKEGKYNFIDNKGKLQNSTWYDEVQPTLHSSFKLVLKTKKGLADSSGKELLSPKYDYVEDFGDGRVKVAKNGKYGLLDYKENFIFPISYDNIFYIPAQNLILTKTNGKTESIRVPENEK